MVCHAYVTGQAKITLQEFATKHLLTTDPEALTQAMSGRPDERHKASDD